jgi:hypothetical protein
MSYIYSHVVLQSENYEASGTSSTIFSYNHPTLGLSHPYGVHSKGQVDYSAHALNRLIECTEMVAIML